MITMRSGNFFQHTDRNDVLQFRPRYHGRAGTDELVASIAHRTTGDGRSALLRRPDAEELYNWLGDWLAQGWDGVPRTCQDRHDDKLLHCVWECDQDPGHAGDHEGPPIGWTTAGGKPGRMSWRNDLSRVPRPLRGDHNVQQNRF
jgi:hypothetical protein